MNERKQSPSEMEADQATDQTRRLGKKFARVKEATRSLKRTGRATTALVAVIALCGVFVLLRPLVSAYNSPRPYRKAFNAEMGREVVPALQAESQAMIKAVGPDILRAVHEGSARRFPEVASKFEVEGKALVDELSAEARARIATRSDRIQKRLDETVWREIPKLAEPQAMELAVANAHKATHAALARFLDTYLKAHTNTAASLQARIESFPVPDRIRMLSDDELRDELTQTLGVLAMNRVSAARSPQMRDFLQTLQLAEAKERKLP